MASGRARRLGAYAAATAAACALGNLAAMAWAVELDVARLFTLGSLVDVDDRAERWLVASMWIDAAYYALLLPVAFLLAPSTTTGDVARVSGSVYALVGMGGALALAFKWPSMFARFDAGDARAAEAFLALTDFIMRRVWNFVCAVAGAAWWVAIARAHPSARSLRVVSLALAALSLVEGVTSIAHQHAIADLVLAPILALLPLWCVLACSTLARGTDAEEMS